MRIPIPPAPGERLDATRAHALGALSRIAPFAGRHGPVSGIHRLHRHSEGTLDP